MLAIANADIHENKASRRHDDIVKLRERERESHLVQRALATHRSAILQLREIDDENHRRYAVPSTIFHDFSYLFGSLIVQLLST